MTRIFVIHPGPKFSTADVFTGLCAGLRANGVDVIEGELDKAMAFQAQLYAAGQAMGVVQEGTQNISYFASPYIAQHAIAVEPDAVITISGHNFNIVSARTMKQAGLKTAILMTESPYFAAYERTMAQVYGTVFTHERLCANEQYFDHPNVHYLPHAFNPEVHRPGEVNRSLTTDAFFCGSLFEERAALFGGVNWEGINFLRRGYEPGIDREQDIVENTDVVEHYRSAKININHHRTTTNFGSGQHIGAGAASSLNPRAYEIPACGSFMLCDDSRAELWDVYGEWAPTYRAGDSQDLENKVRYWLKHPDRREETAAAMHEAVCPHNWTERAKQVLEALLS